MLILLIISPIQESLFGQTIKEYPSLKGLNQKDFIYKQQQEEVAFAYKTLQGGGQLDQILLYKYIASTTTDIFSLAARLNLPYESLASLNKMDRARPIAPGEELLIPNSPGIFAFPATSSDLGLMYSYRDSAVSKKLQIYKDGKTHELFFYPGARFTPEERTLFLGQLFHFPLPFGLVSSGYGYRTSPITKKFTRHGGVDLAAPFGTSVFAAREGIIHKTGWDSVLGQYIIIRHTGGWSTLYGHLSQRLVQLNQKVASGTVIGKLGSSGLSTGPHLHFEVRMNGQSQNPEKIMSLKGRLNK